MARKKAPAAVLEDPSPPPAPEDSPELAPITPALRFLATRIDSLVEDPSNARLHGERNLEAIKGSLARFGQRKPIVVQKDGMVVRAGNGTLASAKSLGWTHIAAVIIDEDPTTATGYAIADNRTSDTSEFDQETLAKLLEALPTDLQEAAGFTDEEFRDLMTELDARNVEEDPDVPEPLPYAVSRPGDLWLMGDHRLLCGDSTLPADLETLMAGEKAALCDTDPPYLVDYTGERPDKDGGNAGGKDWTDRYHEVDIADPAQFFDRVLRRILENLADHAPIYLWHAHKRAGLLQDLGAKAGILWSQQIIWVKPTPVMGRSFWHYQHEPCLMGWRQGSMPEHDGMHDIGSVWYVPEPWVKAPDPAQNPAPARTQGHEHSDVWFVDWEGRKRLTGEHPTQKPLELFARPMKRHTRIGDVVLEPFSGSGSQLIAAHQLARRCYAMEQEPVFVDVAIRRWQKHANAHARHATTGLTWEETAQERGVPTDPQTKRTSE